MSVPMVAWVRTALPRTGLPSPKPGDRLTSGSWENNTNTHAKLSCRSIICGIVCIVFVMQTIDIATGLFVAMI